MQKGSSGADVGSPIERSYVAVVDGLVSQLLISQGVNYVQTLR